MARTLIRFTLNDPHPNPTPQWGLQFGDLIAPLDVRAASTGELLREHWALLWQVPTAQARLPRSAVTLLAPVTADQQFVCQGVNYRSHVQESGLKVERLPFNTLFTKAPSCITAADAPVVRPPHVRLLDYEIELGLVMRQELAAPTSVRDEDLDQWLAGVTIVNDLSARDVQLPQGQFYKGKSYRGFGPVGPGLVLLEPHEWRRWRELHMTLAVNGQLRQDAYCGEMLYAPAATLSELSGLQDLRAGDLIATGTPAGCAARAPGRLTMAVLKLMSERRKWQLFIRKAQANPAYLQPGDQLRAAIRTDDGAIDLGEQTTRIVAA